MSTAARYAGTEPRERAHVGQAVGVELHWVTPDDAELVTASSHLFDGPARPDSTARFLAEPGHHLCIALVDGHPAGFVSGVETIHPDKGLEMFLNELAVDDAYHRQGIGARLVAALRDHATELGCVGMWVLTDADNTAALRTYTTAGAAPPTAHVMLEWKLE
jgi:GNAT superfamily N-acetyltransferase